MLLCWYFKAGQPSFTFLHSHNICCFLLHWRKKPTQVLEQHSLFLTGLKSALLSGPELQPLEHLLFRYTKYRWWPTPRYIFKYLWVGHHLPHVCMRLLSHLGVYLCWEDRRSLKVSMPPQWWIQEKTNAFHTTVHSPESQGEQYPSFKQHDPGKLNMMWKWADLLHYFAMFSNSGTGTGRLRFWASMWGILLHIAKAILRMWFPQKRQMGLKMLSLWCSAEILLCVSQGKRVSL